MWRRSVFCPNSMSSSILRWKLTMGEMDLKVAEKK